MRISEVGGSLSDTSDAVFSITDVPAVPPEISLNRSIMYFNALASGPVTGSQTFTIANSGSGSLNWNIGDNATWLNCSPASGTGYGIVTVSVDPGGLATGSYTGTITIVDAEASNSPQTVDVFLTVKNASQSQLPFGEFATPQDGAVVSGSVPVTGWVLDDLEVVSLKIYNGSSFVGDAVFVEGARPDLEQLYPTYPNNHKAGWGYMLLTNTLPGGGNGTYTLYAKATDKEGHEISLGSKTITVDNINAVKPFGAVDTPAQGGTASGSSYVNWGWVLTPQPNKIPVDGSTIKVWIDGVEVGHPTYNVEHKDVAAIFPSYANSDGAAGYFQFDTTAYTNGVHTIQWSAEDNAGNRDGIGSRYFTIQNIGSNGPTTAGVKSNKQLFSNHLPLHDRIDMTSLPIDYSTPVKVKKGYHSRRAAQTVYPSENGVIAVELRELEPLEIQFSPGTYNLSALPVGSHLEVETGVFSWLPGVGFVGSYIFNFLQENGTGQPARRILLINIKPRH